MMVRRKQQNDNSATASSKSAKCQKFDRTALRARKVAGKPQCGQARLSVGCRDPEFEEQVEELSRQIVVQFDVPHLERSPVIQALARTAAEAELERQRVRAVKDQCRKRAFMFGSLAPPRFFTNHMAEVRWTQRMYRHFVLKDLRQRPRPPKMINSDADMPTEPAGRIAEGARRVLDQLLQLDRYEARAIGRRDRALRSITRQIGRARQNLQNGPN